MAAKSTQERLWLVGGAVAAFVMVLIGYFLLISPQRTETQNVKSQVADQQIQTAALQQRIDTLTAQSKDLPLYKSQLAALQLALPSSSGLPDLLRTLQALGNETLAQVSSLTVGPPTEVSAAAGAVAPAPAEVTTSEAPTSSAETAAPIVPTSSGIYSLSITAQVEGSTSQLGEFLDQLQSVQPRAVLITAITLASGESHGAATSMQLTMQAFVRPPVDAGAPATTVTEPPA